MEDTWHNILTVQKPTNYKSSCQTPLPGAWGLWAAQKHPAPEGSSNILVSSVQFSRSVLSDSLRPHEPQHARPPCPSSTPRDHPNPYPLCRWCHPTISSSVIPFSSCPQSFPASGCLQMSQLFTWGGQSIEVSPSASVLPMNIQD